jgi:hypothetical protein
VKVRSSVAAAVAALALAGLGVAVAPSSQAADKPSSQAADKPLAPARDNGPPPWDWLRCRKGEPAITGHFGAIVNNYLTGTIVPCHEPRDYVYATVQFLPDRVHTILYRYPYEADRSRFVQDNELFPGAKAICLSAIEYKGDAKRSKRLDCVRVIWGPDDTTTFGEHISVTDKLVSRPSTDFDGPRGPVCTTCGYPAPPTDGNP